VGATRIRVQASGTPEVRASLERGFQWLLAHQNSNGWWSTPDQPAVTALVLTALNRAPDGRWIERRPSELSRAYDYLLSSVQPNGSIHRGGLANYNTSLSLMALATAQDDHFLPVIRRARAYLAGTQIDFGEAGVRDTPFDGGVGYGSKYQHSDLNNTLTALEAMRWSEAAVRRDQPEGVKLESDLDWGAVVHFLQQCQNLPSHNEADWVSKDPRDRGGFVYYPGHSMAGGVTNEVTGRVSLRSYGSISYAGLLSFIYARLEADDPRVQAVLDWAGRNYTVEENPGMGPQGHYYYLHLLTKALTAARVDRLQVAQEDGTLSGQDWRAEVTRWLLEAQHPDGSWVNTHPRWWETDRVLVTAYAVLTLELLSGWEGDGG
jgi:squalene-hopene/tetraprenyl-beta-curcumene cyclase